MVAFRALASLSLFALLGASGVSAAALRPKMLARPATPRQPSALEKKDTTDICAEVNLNAAVGVLGLLGVTVSPLKICLCLSGLDAFLQADAAAVALVDLLGLAQVTAALTADINSLGKTCTYPDNATPVCSAAAPCGFTCKAGFRKVGGQCVLRSTAGLVRRDFGQCQPGQSKCGVHGRSSWECIDTRSTLESCGGCTIPLLGQKPSGQDCTAIPGVADVACIQGMCQVSACDDAYEVSADSTTCVLSAPLVVQHVVV